MTSKALGEIALRTTKMPEMLEFYQHVVGLEPMNDAGPIRFLKVADGFAGHTQVIALFDATLKPDQGEHTFAGPDIEQTTLHHIAFAIELQAYAPEKARLKSLGFSVRTAVHRWVQWRALYINDPDGNTVEWVCYDPSIEPE